VSDGLLVASDVTPVPDPRLAKKSVNALSAAVDAHVVSLPLSQPTTGLPDPGGPHTYPGK